MRSPPQRDWIGFSCCVSTVEWAVWWVDVCVESPLREQRRSARHTNNACRKECTLDNTCFSSLPYCPPVCVSRVCCLVLFSFPVAALFPSPAMRVSRLMDDRLPVQCATRRDNQQQTTQHKQRVTNHTHATLATRVTRMVLMPSILCILFERT